MPKRRRKRRKTTSTRQAALVFGLMLLAAASRYIQDHPQVLLLLCAPIAIALYNKISERRRWLASGIAQIDAMSGTDFEKRLYHHFKAVGWSVRLTPASGDFGADVVGTDPNGRRVVIQAKCYGASHKVGVDAVQEVVGAEHYYKARRKIVITNRHLTAKAKELARSAGVEVWERERLVEELAKVGAVDRVLQPESP